MKKFKTYSYRMKPTKELAKKLRKLLDSADFLFNCLADRANELARRGYEMKEIETDIRMFRGFTDLTDCEVESVKKQVIEVARRMMNYEFECIRHRNHFRSRRVLTITRPPVRGKNVIIEGIGNVPVVFHRELPWGSHVFKVELKEDCLGAEYYLLYSFYCNTPEAETVIPLPENILGLDYAQDGLYVDSEGRSGDYPGFKAIGRARAVRYREAANRCVYGSRNWVKYQRRLKKYEQHIRNQREDWQYNKVRELANEYEAIACESLNLKEMQAQNPALIPKMDDNGWGLFRKKLGEKLSDQGKTLVSIDRYSPTSQLCSRCGYRAGKLPLSERIFRCPNCGLEMDRDLNAAINIREEGANMLLAG